MVIPRDSTDHSFMKFRHSFSRKRDEAAFIKNMGFLVLHSLPLPNLFGYFYLHALIPFFLKEVQAWYLLGRKHRFCSACGLEMLMVG